MELGKCQIQEHPKTYGNSNTNLKQLGLKLFEKDEADEVDWLKNCTQADIVVGGKKPTAP